MLLGKLEGCMSSRKCTGMAVIQKINYVLEAHWPLMFTNQKEYQCLIKLSGSQFNHIDLYNVYVHVSFAYIQNSSKCPRYTC